MKTYLKKTIAMRTTIIKQVGDPLNNSIMKKKKEDYIIEQIIDLYGIELIAGYSVREEPYQYEECHGIHIIDGGRIVDLESVELIINGQPIQLINMLNSQQHNYIINQLSI